MRPLILIAALLLSVGLALNPVSPPKLLAADNTAQPAQNSCDAQPVVDTITWTDGVVFALRECASNLFQVTATRTTSISDWAIEKAVVAAGIRVDLMGHWTIPTYSCKRNGHATMSCG